MAPSTDWQTETVQGAVDKEAPPVLICARCGGGFSMWLWQPRLRCPHCRMLGYPDRAMHNLLPLDWDCPNCGATNAVSVNFCVTCGTGLTSRCLRCERPIYTAICPHCGAHQASMLRYQIAQTRRVIWEPIVRARIQEQQVQEQQAQATSVLPSGQEIDPAGQAHRPSSRSHRPSFPRTLGGIALIVFGFYLLEQQGVISFSQMFLNATSGVSLPAWMVAIWNEILSWGTAVTSLLNQLSALSTEDPRYLYLFGTVVIGLASLPLLFYLFDRLTRRLFP